MYTLTKTQIIAINRASVRTHGGQFIAPNNLLNEAPLDYLVEMVDQQVFGEPAYPTVGDKAAFYLFSIISNHVFQDGNKRTGLASALLFLDANGYRLYNSDTESATTTDQPVAPARAYVYKFVLEVASGSISLNACRAWFAQHIAPKQ